MTWTQAVGMLTVALLSVKVLKVGATYSIIYGTYNVHMLEVNTSLVFSHKTGNRKQAAAVRQPFYFLPDTGRYRRAVYGRVVWSCTYDKTCFIYTCIYIYIKCWHVCMDFTGISCSYTVCFSQQPQEPLSQSVILT